MEERSRGDLADLRGTIFDIQKFSIHDGPGIRTTVFLKGCPLHCPWCHNPEALKRTPELIFYQNRCIGCGACFEACPIEGALHRNGARRIDRLVCTNCGLCTETCYAQALMLNGREVTVGEALAEVEKDRPFYEQSHGGMTLSGGEPLNQPDFTTALLRLAKEAGLHTALDTSGMASREALTRALDYTDLVLYDLKLMDRAAHRQACGGDNTIIHDNLRCVNERGIPVYIRAPIIPHYTDHPDNVAAIADFAATLSCVEEVDLMRYHRLGESKWERIDLEYPLKGIQPPSDETMQSLKEIVAARGLKVVVEG
jgi:pyruvate formate lyase activating enzyme